MSNVIDFDKAKQRLLKMEVFKCGSKKHVMQTEFDVPLDECHEVMEGALWEALIQLLAFKYDPEQVIDIFEDAFEVVLDRMQEYDDEDETE